MILRDFGFPLQEEKDPEKRLKGTHSLRQQKAHLPLYSTPNMSSNRYPLRTEFIMGGGG